MNISIDGGALYGNLFTRFANYIFTKNLIHELFLYDKKNTYIVYTLSAVGEKKKNIDYRVLRPKTLWSSVRISIEETREKKNIYFALNQSLPLFTPARIFTFSHGLSFYFFPELYPDSYRSMKRQTEIFIRRSEKIIVSSMRIKNELASIYSRYMEKIEVLPYGIPYDMTEYKKVEREPFFLFVGMNHPIKNIPFLLRAFRIVKEDRRFRNHKLYLFGNFSDERENKDIVVFSGKSRRVLKKLYQRATAYLSASLYESFNFPVLEALSQDCPIITLQSAVIPELENYVNMAKNLDEFAFLMKQAASSGLKKIHRPILKEMFSWKNYVTRLVALY